MSRTRSPRKRLTREEFETQRGAMPLSEFPPHMLDRIMAEVAQDKPPPQWLGLGIMCVNGIDRPMAWIPSRGWYEWHWARGIDPDARRERLETWLRARVIERDGYVCGLCGGDVEPDDVHIDHIMPWSLGGRNELDNLQVAHSRCNLSKGNRV